jgi:hypothetical protein
MLNFEETVKVVCVKDIKTQLKDGKGRLGLVLECYGDKGTILEVEIPDINLNVPELELEYVDGRWCGISIPAKRKGYIGFEINKDKDENLFTYRQVSRTVTKEQLEKELGYKLNIK